MGIDANIILQGRPTTQLLNPMDVATQSMNMKRLAQQNQLADQEVQSAANLKDAYRKGTSVGADGKVSYNQGMIMSELVRSGSPDKAMEAQKQFSAMDVEKRKIAIDQANELAGQANPQNWTAIKQKAKEVGYQYADTIPDVYDKTYHDKWRMGAMNAKEQLVFEQNEREMVNKSLDRKEARDERRFQSGIKMDEKTQGLKTPYGLANTVDDAKQLKDAHESKTTFDNKIDQMIALRTTKKGGETFDREAVQRGKQLSKDLLLEYKNMAKLGVLSKSDEDIINAIIPEDPLEYNSPLAAIQGQDPILTRLKSFKADSDKDFQNRISTRTRSGIDTAAPAKDKNVTYLEKFSDQNLDSMGDNELALLYKQVKGAK